MILRSRVACVAAVLNVVLSGGVAHAQPQPPAGECTAFATTLATAAAFSPDAQIELAQRDEALARLDELRSLAWPQVSMFGRSLAGDADLSDVQLANQVGLRLTQDIFDFSKRQLRQEAAQYDLESARLLVDASRDVAALETGAAYLDALKAREQRQALTAEIEFLGLLSKTLQDLAASGQATADEVLETNARLSAAKAQVSQLTFLEQQAIVTTRLLTGVKTFEPCPSPNLDGELAASYKRVAASDAALQQVIADHPRIRAANSAISARSAEQNYEKRAWLPTLRGVGTYAYGQTDGTNDWRERSSVGLEFSMPLFSGGGQTARESAAVARSRQASKGRELASLEIEQQLRRAIQSYALGTEQFTSRSQAADYKREQLNLLRQGYDNRTRTLRELVEVQSELTANQLSAIASRYDLLAASLTIHVLSGDARTRANGR